jgi:proline iminopeptidase
VRRTTSARCAPPDGHDLYWEAVGNPDGTPALYLHGGPGSGAGPAVHRRFDPAAYRVVLFDQRGCGRSRPLADVPMDLRTNTTAHLLEDVERLRTLLAIERWIVYGVSWGVALALAYAQRHPERVAGMVLGAVTAGTRREIEWITWDMGRVFPREWERFVSRPPQATTGTQVCAAYARLLADHDPAVRDDAARAWCAWEDTHVSLMPSWKPDPRFEDPVFRATFARLVTHYWSNGCFLEDGEILRGMDRLAGIPGVLVHGRYDVSGPLDTAWQLHRAWPDSELVVIGDAGHGGGGFTREVVSALDRFS